ncbi:DegQ family serine endoprotease [Ectothiorhodospira lacustris]|uniref:DegQ family serine endoprotease n=1 Tax=Ectothiorhodospira lacustris TaxID=2899127 RepID=UPI001EE9AD8B|nr:DegQ family serine endoprotease [Ectothiorhodospira lacustris]MCG5510829.1 DegQ family serine endoprotease [Ectothiorhodospira lacustris]MCG5522625.1 DegQ family serine endoprotease [Ectothiorhodospira lacustris]
MRTKHLHPLHKPLLWPLLLVLLLGLSLPAAARLPVEVDGEPLPSLAPMLERTIPGVVNLATRGRVQERVSPLFDDPFFRRFFDLPQAPRERQTQGLGSGVILDAGRGFILTNDHVIRNADEIVVTLHDGRRLDAKVIGTDQATDLAVLQVEAEGLKALPAADSDALKVGDFVVAIGNPFGLGQTVTSGIVSALGRTGLSVEAYEDFIQTDASINPGNSGGALVNLRGELVGINSAILTRGGGNIGIGFAIPVNMALQVMDHLVEYGEVRRGRLGVSVQDLTPDLARAFGIEQTRGAVIARVEPASPGARAGLKEGDVVTRVNGRAVRNAAELRNAIGLLRVGATVELEVLRDKRSRVIRAQVSEIQASSLDGGRISPRLEGAALGAIQEDSPLYGAVEGVLVARVAPGSPAARAGLRPGDLILSVNRRPVTSLEEVRQAAGTGGQRLLLNLRRDSSAFFLLLQ